MHNTSQIHKNIIEQTEKLNIDPVIKGIMDSLGIIKVLEVIIKIIKIILNVLIIINAIVKIIIAI